MTVHTGAETIHGKKLFKGGNYMSKYGISYFPFLANGNAYLQLLSQPGAQMFLQKSVVYGMTSRPIFCSLGRGRSGPPTLYQLYGCCLEQYQGRQDREGS